MAELAEYGPDVERRAFRRAVFISLVGHGMLLGLLVLHPSFLRTPHELPGVVMVDLVAAPPGPAPLPAPKPAPPPPAPKVTPPPAEAPKPVPPPPPPPPTPKEVVLPKEPVKPPEKPPPPKPKPEKPAPRPEPVKPKSAGDLNDVLKELRQEAGETRPEPVQTAAAPPAARNVAPDATGGGGGSVRVSPEVLAWMKEARIHVRKNWVVAPALRSEPLETDVRVTLDAGGNVIGEPVITRRSGNPWYDDSVVRAIKKASPLPAPPEAGDWPFVFQPEESS